MLIYSVVPKVVLTKTWTTLTLQAVVTSDPDASGSDSPMVGTFLVNNVPAQASCLIQTK